MINRFQDRSQAGQLLAKALTPYAKRSDVIVLGLPRGGVPVAIEVAGKLHAPLDVFIVRKLGVPGHSELAMGAIATGGVRVLNEEVVDELGISPLTIDAVAAEEQKELARRELAYRGHEVSPNLRGKIVILVDDGIATGSTMRAAVRAIRRQQPARIVVAVPTAAASSCTSLEREADEVIALLKPEEFYAVGEWYESFPQTTDQEVTDLLAKAGHGPQLREAVHPT